MINFKLPSINLCDTINKVPGANLLFRLLEALSLLFLVTSNIDKRDK
jgi:hypothetical protein